VLNREDAIVGGATVVVGGAAVAAATSTDQTGPILAFAGALIVSLIAAYTTDRRQRAQHRHDRGQADLADLRATLEQALGRPMRHC
jgi:membrane protein implicated in regulation of membrane protease activity